MPTPGLIKRLALLFWLARRHPQTWELTNARHDARHSIRQQWNDHGPRGRGSKAWRRAQRRVAEIYAAD